MTRLSDYTTEELERLTTLTLETALPGECVASRPPELQRLDSLYGRVDTTPVLLLGGERYTQADGQVWLVATTTASARSYIRRRVRSLADATELDPPQAEMLAELARRKAPVFTVGELVVANGETRKVSDAPTRYASAAWATSSDVVWLDNGREPASWIGRHSLRPATPTEVAAYHRAHCQPKPAPVVISNATHAGQWVQWNYGPCLVMAAGAQGDEKVEIVSLKGGRFYVRPDYLTLIDPPTWPQ